MCETDILKQLACDCPPPCEEITYQLTISTAKLRQDDFKVAPPDGESAFNALTSFSSPPQSFACQRSANQTACMEKFDDDYAQVNVYFQQLNSFVYQEVSDYAVSIGARTMPSAGDSGECEWLGCIFQLETLLGDVGGITGLALGFTFVTVVELAVAIFSLLTFRCTRFSLIRV
jgi:hypothetical protein